MQYLPNNTPEVVLYGIFAFAAAWVVISLLRREWDGGLRWLLAGAFVCVFNAGLWRILSFLGAVTREFSDYAVAAPLAAVLVILAVYLHLHIKKTE